MKPIAFFLASLALSLGSSATALHAAEPVGVQKISVVTQDYPRPLAVTVWYPSSGDGQPAAPGSDKVFQPSSANTGATVREGRFPLILMSHGSGSRAEGMAWIGVELAKAGYIVAAPNHPGTTSGDSTPAATPKIWERAQDMSVLITALSTNKRWQSSIDQNRVGILGFSLGGSTALELAGARPDLDGFIRYCDEHPPGALDCSWFRGGRGYADGAFVKVEPFDMREIDRKLFEQSNHDPRITAVVAVDPGLGTLMKPESVAKVEVPVTVINLGSKGKVPLAVEAEQLSKDLPRATFHRVENSDHYSFLPVCQPGAAAFLRSLGEDDPICEETARPRGKIHEELSRLIVAAFEHDLKRGN
ncbi:alpha/beta hydrolase family protein [Neorhizobium sp. NPDC001467]|uniref:alpha/beta hydrolase family protein n=1 Tax=Neorhizobium sp. NPDC001467 TaxID=3390595 RepID=UPI003D02011A